MKFRQQIKTSATNLLGKSGQGFGTVAAHLEIPRGVREYTDNLGINLIEGEAKASYCFALVEGWLLLNRTIVAPADQTGRSNHVAHTLAAPESELQVWLNQQQASGAALWSPAALILQFEVNGLWKDSWNEEPRELGESDMIDIPHLDGEVVWTPRVWQGHPEKALAALTTENLLKELKWNWEGINDGVDQLKCYAQAFAVLDPDQGKTRTRPEIDALFPTNLRAAWEWTFATVVLDAQRPDEFKWFGVSKERSRGNTSKREEFVPLQAETTLDDPREGYVKNKEEAITQMNRDAYHEAANKLKSLLEKWSSKFGKKYPQQIPDAPDCLSELDKINESCSLSRTEIDAKKDELTRLENNLAEAKEALNKSRDNAEGWREFAENAITQSGQIEKPTSLDEVRREFCSAKEWWSDNKAAELDSEFHRLEDLTQSLQSKIAELRKETDNLKQALSVVNPVKISAPHSIGRGPLPGPSAVPTRSLHFASHHLLDSRALPPKHAEAGTQITEVQDNQPQKTKGETNPIWMWTLSTTFVILVGVIGWSFGDYQFSKGREAGILAGRAEQGQYNAEKTGSARTNGPSQNLSQQNSETPSKVPQASVNNPDQPVPNVTNQNGNANAGLTTQNTPEAEGLVKNPVGTNAVKPDPSPKVKEKPDTTANTPLPETENPRREDKAKAEPPQKTAGPSTTSADNEDKSNKKEPETPNDSEPVKTESKSDEPSDK